MGTLCLNCGDKGFTNAYVFCVKCLEVAVHRYCLENVTFDEFVYWVCDDCEVKELGELNIKKSDAITVGNKDCTSSRHCKVSSEVNIDVPETTLKRCEGRLQQLQEPPSRIEMVEHRQIGGDTSGMKMSKKKSSPTSLRDEIYEPRLERSSSEQSHESQKSIGCNERTQSANVSPLPAKQSKEEVTAPLDKLARENFQAFHLKRSCEGDVQPSAQRKSSGMTEKTESISSSGNHQEKESVPGKYIRLTPQIGTVFNEEPSQFLKGEQPNEPQHAGQERALPLVDFIWRGSFNILNKEYETFDGLLAHLSVKACQKVYEEASLFPALLQLEMLPKSDVWPKSFTISEPTDDNIALYFFPSDTRCEKEFDQLVEQMIGEELALRATVTNAELLVFTSTELPLLYWRFQGKYYLWGVFKAKRDSSGNTTMPNGRSKPST
ncbi:uncharacterized protein LOC107015994 isoform X2 [Solanum pennellii]|uniref:Uncharacterized protein LOC107015994 isoform X1 n=1 Tax=Solanum pennellii TaxID=28526 RepID=A0ABM1GJK2_SOLPN|nr:uncharacterized protein LOC107015994 isoform X1 [Solanum pennellii]XP_015071948.1 uncharacterized protein LOC107015994 isoform X2 [Solanum pennellii]